VIERIMDEGEKERKGTGKKNGYEEGKNRKDAKKEWERKCGRKK
jgi:hypothetical protein